MNPSPRNGLPKRLIQVHQSLGHYLTELARVRSPGDLYRWSYFKLPYLFPLMSFPPRVEIEITNECNLGCVYCTRTIGNRALGAMSVELFARIAAEIGQQPNYETALCGLGEPSLHPDFEKILDVVRRARMKTRLYTNGLIFTRLDAAQIVKSGIDTLIVSVDGTDAASFGRQRVGGDYDSLRAGVESLFGTRSRMGSRKPQIQIRHVIVPRETREQLQEFRDEWSCIADSVKFNYLIGPTSNKGRDVRGRLRCRDIRGNIHIRWDGRVPLCGFQHIVADTEWIGDLNHETIHEVWHHERLGKMRENHRRRDLSSCTFCARCEAR